MYVNQLRGKIYTCNLFSHSSRNGKRTDVSKKSEQFGSGTPKTNKRKNKANNAFIRESPCNSY